MTTELTTYAFNSSTIRVVTIQGEPWFVAKDVCDLLGYGNSREAISRHVAKSQTNSVVVRDGNRGNPSRLVISEGGVNALILGSHLPAAQRFKLWVTDTVLPAIRKDGGYIKGEEKVATSKDVAPHLEKRHDVVMRASRLSRSSLSRSPQNTA